MPSRRRSRPIQPLSPLAVFFVLLIVVFLGYRVFRGGLPQNPAAEVKTLVATLPVDFALPTNPPAVIKPSPQAPTATLPPDGAAEGFAVFFSDPLSRASSGGPESGLIQAVSAARTSVDMAIYNLTLDSLGDALIAAQRRGVQVRLVMESEAMDKQLPRRLVSSGIPIVGDQREGLMHNKFTVIDGGEVWTGSMNYTTASAYTDFNNLLRVRSKQVAADYEASFNEMFERRQFGPDKVPDTPYPKVTVSGAPVEVYFSPDDRPARHVVEVLRQARTSIDILAYSFTRDDFAAAILERAQAGVRVRGVFDRDQYEQNTGGEFDKFRQAGLDVRLDGITGLLHDKVIIIDDETVITGSYNFSGNAERTNDENLVIIRDPALAKAYLAHFEQVYAASPAR